MFFMLPLGWSSTWFLVWAKQLIWPVFAPVKWLAGNIVLEETYSVEQDVKAYS